MAHSMRSPTLAAVGLLAAAATAQHVFLPFSQPHGVPGISPRASQQTALRSAIYPYVVNVTVGDPPQELALLVSPATGHTWVPNANTVACSPLWYYADVDQSALDSYAYDIPEPKCLWGSYNKSLSATHLPPNRLLRDFSDTYVDGSYARGTNMTDRLVVGGIELDDYPMGLVEYTHRWIGTLGLGYNASASYASASGSSSRTYANFMDRIVASGRVASPVYSMWLDDPRGASGGLLFGAVDRSRYTGDLVRLSAGSPDYSYSYSYDFGFVTSLVAVNGTSASGDPMPAIRTNDFPVEVTLGPGEVFSYLPDIVADQLADMAGASYNETNDYFTIPCDASGGTLVFELGGSGGPRLTAEVADLAVPQAVVGTQRWYMRGLPDDQCLFGIQKHYSDASYVRYNLGSAVLRRTYLAFDLANYELALAPARFASGSGPAPTIVAVESYGAPIPAETVFCTSRRCRFDDESRYGPGSGSGYEQYDADKGLEHWQRIAIGVGVSFGVLALAGAAFAVVVCVRLRRGDGPGKDLDEEGSEGSDSDAAPAESGPAVAQTGVRSSVVLPPGPLPVIQEGAEPGANPAAAQPPAISVTPPEPAGPNRDSPAVSALSEEQEPQAATDAPPERKGKEAVRSGDAS